MKSILINILLLFCLYQISECGQKEQATVSKEIPDQAKLVTQNVYAKLFKLRREEKNQLLKILMDEKSYERRYKLLEAGYEKLLTVLSQTKKLLETSKYDPLADKFPSEDNHLVDAISVTLENTCLFGEMILHFPDMSYMILQRLKSIQSPSDGEWKDLINWCLKYSQYFFGRIVDDNSQILLSLLEQEINPSKRSSDFVNPYRESQDLTSDDKNSKSSNKPRKKLKKGPQMSRSEL